MERKDYKFTYPFEPPWEDLAMEVITSNGTKVYIFDTCVRRDPEERAAIDREVAGVLMRIERRKFMEMLAQEEKLTTQEPLCTTLRLAKEEGQE